MSACNTKHKEHKTSPVKIFLKDDKRNSRRFVMDIYDWQEYTPFKGHCLGKDVTSQHIQMNGGYEPGVTALWQQLLRRGNKRNYILDFGAHIGWYTLQAALYGYTVVPIEADIQNLRLLVKNATYNKVDKKLIPNFSFIDEDSPPIEIENKKLIHIMKADLKTSVIDAIAMCENLFAEQKINYAILKINQEKELALQIMDSVAQYGYTTYVIPKEPLLKYTKDPLNYIKKNCLFNKLEYSMNQSYLFIKDKT